MLVPVKRGARLRAKGTRLHEFDPGHHIVNADLLIRVFGEWPSFHDAEIVWIRLDRGHGAPSLEAAFHVFRMTKDVDERGYYVLKNHTLTIIRFDNIVLRELKWFNHQNSIDDLDVGTGSERRFGVAFPSNGGCEAEFECDQIKVLSVEPYKRKGGQSDGMTMEPPKPG